MECPDCQAPITPPARSCPRCGVMLPWWFHEAKAEAPKARPEPAPAGAPSLAIHVAMPGESEVATPAATGAFALRSDALDRSAGTALGLGALGAALAMASPLAGHILATFAILVHEFGHAVTDWIFGYPSFPAFDFVHGGGLTFHGDRMRGFAFVFYGAVGVLAYLWRGNRPALGAIGALAGLHALALATGWDAAVSLAMGRGMELVFAGIFLYRALGGWACRYPVERPLYAMVGLFFVASNARFAWRLLHDPAERWMYENMKGSVHFGDFDRLTREFLHVELDTVVWAHLALTPLPIFAALWLFRHRDRWHAALARLVSRTPRSPASR